jgi:hypothetical protein
MAEYQTIGDSLCFGRAIVIPAKAGIYLHLWIPAFAGMTVHFWSKRRPTPKRSIRKNYFLAELWEDIDTE